MTIQSPDVEPPPPLSAFVTVVAWAFLIVSLPTTLVFGALFLKSLGTPLMYSIGQLVVLLLTLACAGSFIAALGLLVRRDWARRLFIGLLWLGIADNFFALFVAAPVPQLPWVRPAWLALSVCLMALFAWLIVRFSSVRIKSEFAGLQGAA